MDQLSGGQGPSEVLLLVPRVEVVCPGVAPDLSFPSLLTLPNWTPHVFGGHLPFLVPRAYLKHCPFAPGFLSWEGHLPGLVWRLRKVSSTHATLAVRDQLASLDSSET